LASGRDFVPARAANFVLSAPETTRNFRDQPGLIRKPVREGYRRADIEIES
jgi:hypothetical protein